eukprot:g2005.t1
MERRTTGAPPHTRRLRAILSHLGTSAHDRRRRVGFVGYGKVAQYLTDKVTKHPRLELAFVCDLFSPQNVRDSSTIPDSCKLYDLERFDEKRPDLVVEVAHPDVTKKYGEMILRKCNLLIASTTAFADPNTSARMMQEAERATGYGLYLASGALWGAQDIKRMSERGALEGLSLVMTKHPASLKVYGILADRLEAAKDRLEETVLYDGPIRDLCPLAPNNVNTMATAAFAALKTTGFDKTRAVLKCDPRLSSTVISVTAKGPPLTPGGDSLRVTSIRENPSKIGAITGEGTFSVFFSSLLVAAEGRHGDGYHIC